MSDPVFEVIRPGLSTTLQDRGRIGYQRFGVPVSGAIDPEGLAIANALVGNSRDSGALEVRLFGPRLLLKAQSARVAVVGPATVTVDGQPVQPGRSFRLVEGQTLDIGGLKNGATAYLAVAGGFSAPAVMGSVSTLARAGLGGFGGRPLMAGDALSLVRASAPEAAELALAGALPGPPEVLRVVLGPQDDMIAPEGIEAFLAGPYEVTTDADRMGVRFAGPAIAHRGTFDIVSDGNAPGAIQVPGSRQPILLLADRGTTGGYPKIATVISADLPAAGRLLPGAKVRFRAVGVEEAEAAGKARRAALEALIAGIAPVADVGLDLDALVSANLISGVVAGTEV